MIHATEQSAQGLHVEIGTLDIALLPCALCLTDMMACVHQTVSGPLFAQGHCARRIPFTTAAEITLNALSTLITLDLASMKMNASLNARNAQTMTPPPSFITLSLQSYLDPASLFNPLTTPVTTPFKALMAKHKLSVVYTDQCMSQAPTRKSTMLLCSPSILVSVQRNFGRLICPGPKVVHCRSSAALT